MRHHADMQTTLPDAAAGSVEDLTANEIRDARARLGPRVLTTPVLQWEDPMLAARLPEGTRLALKLELFQRTGSFKARGALLNTDLLDEAQKQRGITAISAGNHAIAAAFAAREAGTHAKVVMTATANPLRVARVRSFGGEVVLAPDVHAGFALVRRIEEEEGRTLLHPFEGRTTALGTATLALEFLEQCPDLEAIVVPVGGGGLAAGVANAVKVLAPQVQVFGVEPEGADSMHRSFAAGSPQPIERVATIADSLGAPFALPISYTLCRRHLDALVKVTDEQLLEAMALLAESAKLAVEPAGAAATAALLGPLRERLAGKRVGLIVCGANIDSATLATRLAQRPVAQAVSGSP